MPARLLARIVSRAYSRYLIASLAALGCDVLLFLALLGIGVSGVVASATGYALGIAVHWWCSTRFVFADAGAAASIGGDRMVRKGLFLATAFLGLAITMAIVGAAQALGIDARLAKLVAIAASFQATYVARRVMVFQA